MAGPSPVRRVATLEIDRAVHMPPQDNALGKVGRQRCESLEESLRYVSLDVIPVLRAIHKLVRQEADDLEDVLPRRCPGRINDRGRDGEKDGVVQVELTRSKRCEHAMQRSHRLEASHRHTLDRAGLCLEAWRLAERVVADEHGDARLPTTRSLTKGRDEVLLANDG